MATWKKPLRSILRLIRKQRLIPDIDFGQWWQAHPELGKLTGLLLDVIPGLGHLTIGCLKSIWLILLTWLILILLGIFFMPSAWGFMFLGFAVGVHTWILMRHKIIKDLKVFREKMIAAVLLVIMLFIVYRTLPRVVLPNLTGAYTSLTIPADGIEPQDYFLATRNYEKASLNRGSLVVFQPYSIGHRNTRVTVGQIIALPGESIELKGSSFVVNGQELDNRKYPVPNWLRNRKISYIINQKTYFVASEYNVTEQGRNLDSGDIHRACIIKTDDIQAKVFMRWQPISKRGFLKQF
ncbi:MAG: hypothetical protein JXB29_02135 [Sedimentisphaerales bacterium]|nr:hypothetical protein [Sedimentisphaerales bacterium]